MIKLAQPYIPEEAIKKCTEVLRSGDLVQGKYVQEFEQALSDYLGAKHVIVVSSGTAALHLSLIALGIGPGDEVIVPAFSFPATANVVELVGAKPVFVDINLEDFCINISLIEREITKRTKAIIPVHEFGQAADLDGIIKIADKYNLVVIEDAACALGTEFKSRKVGIFGHTGCFSLHPRKAITTGEGGVIVTSDNQLDAKLRSLRNHGIIKIAGKIDFTHAGFNYRMTDFQATLGLIQLQHLEEIITQRKAQADYYSFLLKPTSWMRTPINFPDRRMIFQSYHVMIDSRFSAAKLKEWLLNLGIEVNYGAYSIPFLTYFKNKYQFSSNAFPNSRSAFEQGLAFPVGSHISNEIIDFIVESTNGFKG